MQKFVFNYKRWYFRLITIANLLIPIFLFMACGKHLKGLENPVSTDISTGLIISTVAAISFLGFGLIYIFQSFKTGNHMNHEISKDKIHYQRLFKGILWHATSISIFILMVTLKYCKKIDSGDLWFKYIIYSLAGITIIFGIISNSYIHLYESKNYFQIFFHRHKEEDIKEVMEKLTVPKKNNVIGDKQ